MPFWGYFFYTPLRQSSLRHLWRVRDDYLHAIKKKSFVRRYHTLSPCIFSLCLISLHARYATEVQQLLDIFSA